MRESHVVTTSCEMSGQLISYNIKKIMVRLRFVGVQVSGPYASPAAAFELESGVAVNTFSIGKTVTRQRILKKQKRMLALESLLKKLKRFSYQAISYLAKQKGKLLVPS